MVARSFRIAGWFLLLTVVLLSGCKHKPVPEPPLGMMLDDIYSTANTNPDVDLYCKAMPSYLQEMEDLIPVNVKSNPLDLTFIFRTAGAYYGYAFSCMEDVNKEEAASLYLKGRDHALGELRRYSFFDSSFNDSIPRFRRALEYNFDKRNLPALYWTAANWFGWITLNLDSAEARRDLQRVEAILEFVNKLDRTYNNGTAHAILASVYGLRSTEEIGDPEKARQEFENAFLYTSDSILAVHVMYAKFYAVQTRDRELFQKTLKKVIETPANTYPEKTFVNEAARRKAQLLLKNADVLFKPSGEKKAPETPTPPGEVKGS